jgi:hypothetical protein
MGTDINASLAFSDSSGAQGGTISSGDFIIGGSGGVTKATVPTWAIIGLGLVAVLVFFGWLLKR